jgi:hypothetical protein
MDLQERFREKDMHLEAADGCTMIVCCSLK